MQRQSPSIPAALLLLRLKDLIVGDVLEHDAIGDYIETVITMRTFERGWETDNNIEREGG